MGNKLVLSLLLSASFLLCISCLERNGKVANIKEKKIGAPLYFIPDTTINNKLILENSESAAEFSNNKQIKLVDYIRQSPVAIFFNKSKQEYLYAYQYEGGNSLNSFSCFEVGIADKNMPKQYNILTVENFSTESGVRLGMPVDALLSLKGSNYEVKNDTLIRYRINNYSNSEFLKRYNMPEYFLECMVRKGIIVKYKFGFTRP